MHVIILCGIRGGFFFFFGGGWGVGVGGGGGLFVTKNRYLSNENTSTAP